VGGHATIGGLGPPSRLYGTALDHVVGATVVTADGSAVNVSATENADLFWAIKGAGASFGVITEMDIITHPAPSNITSYTYTFSGRPYAQHADRTKAWQTLVSDPALSRKFASQLIFTEIGMIIQGTFFGTQAEWDALNMTAVFPGSSSADVVVLDDWAGALGQWAEDAALEIGGGLPNSFYAQSLTFTPQTLMSDPAIAAFLAYLDSANPDTLVWFAIFDLAGGAVNDVAPAATAYAHRDALFYLQAYVSNPLGKLSATSHAYIANMTALLSRANPAVLANGEYPGYVDPSLVDPQEGYWRYNYPQLQQVKAKWDPKDMFHNPQSVRLP
jgi:FAD/FMN-containing dehydrogenase